MRNPQTETYEDIDEDLAELHRLGHIIDSKDSVSVLVPPTWLGHMADMFVWCEVSFWVDVPRHSSPASTGKVWARVWAVETDRRGLARAVQHAAYRMLKSKGPRVWDTPAG